MLTTAAGSWTNEELPSDSTLQIGSTPNPDTIDHVVTTLVDQSHERGDAAGEKLEMQPADFPNNSRVDYSLPICFRLQRQ